MLSEKTGGNSGKMAQGQRFPSFCRGENRAYGRGGVEMDARGLEAEESRAAGGADGAPATKIVQPSSVY